MIRRTLTGGLLATVAALALVPTAAGAAQAAPAPLSAASALAPHLLPVLPSAPVQRAPAVHRAGTARHSQHVNRPSVHRPSVHPLGRVVTRRLPLNVRSGPGTGYRVIGVRHAHRLVALTCRTYGSWVHGTRQWYRLTHGRGYVSAHYVRVRRTVPWC